MEPDQPTATTKPSEPVTRMRRTLGRRSAVAGAAIAAAVALGVGVAAAQTSGSSTPTPSPSPATPGPDGPGPDHGGGPHGRGGPGRRDGTIHSEGVRSNGSGGFQTVSQQVGEVTAVSPGSIELTSADHFSRTYTVDEGTVVDAGRDGIATVKKGDTASVMALVDGKVAKAKDVRDLTNLRALHDQWAPHPPAGGAAGQPSGPAPAANGASGTDAPPEVAPA